MDVGLCLDGTEGGIGGGREGTREGGASESRRERARAEGSERVIVR